MRLRRQGFRTAPSALAALVVALGVLPGELLPAPAPLPPDLQVAEEGTELRWSRSGRLLGRLRAGTPLDRLSGRAGWSRVGLRGWMWSVSLSRGGDGYRVTPPEENLRARPNGAILGVLERGVEVRRIGGEGRWYEIELVGWVDDAQVRPLEPEPDETEDPEEAAADEDAGDDPADAAAEPDAAAPPAPPADRALPIGRLSAAAALRDAPAGGQIAQLPSGLVLRPIETRGRWTRVAVEGWVPSAAVRAGGEGGLSVAAVATAPESFAGRTVTWTLEHVALQQADAWRRDFDPGEYFALARAPGDGGRYVYLAVPDELVERFRSLGAFETFRVEGRIRTGRSELTGNPIVAVTRLLP